jgi:hypothetical protein
VSVKTKLSPRHLSARSTSRVVKAEQMPQKWPPSDDSPLGGLNEDLQVKQSLTRQLFRRF